MENIIYGLECPLTGYLRYIGKSTSGLDRPLSHLNKSHSEKVNEWISELKLLGFDPIIKVLEETIEANLLADKEKFWIYQTIKNGGVLLNVACVTSAMVFTNYTLADAMTNQMSSICSFIKLKRKEKKMTQEEFAKQAGVGLRFVRELENGKTTLMMNKVLQCLNFFNAKLEVKLIK